MKKLLFIAILLTINVSSFSQKIDWDRKTWIDFGSFFDYSFTGYKFSNDSVYQCIVTKDKDWFTYVFHSKAKITIHGDTAIINEDRIKYIKLEYSKKLIKVK